MSRRARPDKRGVPTVVLTRIDFERLTNDVISSEANIFGSFR